MKKTIITVVGKDTVGIIAAVCSYLADNKDDLEKIGDEIGVVIKMQHEDIFNSMHRI